MNNELFFFGGNEVTEKNKKTVPHCGAGSHMAASATVVIRPGSKLVPPLGSGPGTVRQRELWTSGTPSPYTISSPRLFPHSHTLLILSFFVPFFFRFLGQHICNGPLQLHHHVNQPPNDTAAGSSVSISTHAHSSWASRGREGESRRLSSQVKSAHFSCFRKSAFLPAPDCCNAPVS